MADPNRNFVFVNTNISSYI